MSGLGCDLAFTLRAYKKGAHNLISSVAPTALHCESPTDWGNPMRSVVDFQVSPALPIKLASLRELAFNVWWCWNPVATDLFRRVDEELWEQTNHNPVHILGTVSQKQLASLAKDEAFLSHMEAAHRKYTEYLDATDTWYARTFGHASGPRYAYFSMEYGLTESIRTYSGGLGVLSGDHLKSASDLGLPLIGVGLLYHKGYFRQYLNPDGWQQEHYPGNDYHNLPIRPVMRGDGTQLTIPMEMFGDNVRVVVWKISVGRISLYLLDANLPDNPEEYRQVTGQLYGGDREMRVRQEIILGIGGYRALAEMGFDPPVCHMNEGHSAFLALERIRHLMDRSGIGFEEARVACSAGNIFTTHTPVPAGFDLFSRELIEKYFAGYLRRFGIDTARMLELGRESGADEAAPLNMAYFAMRNATYINAVSVLHSEVTREMISPGFKDIPLDEVPVTPITNGIHMRSWISHDMSELFRRYLGPEWYDSMADPEMWKRIDRIPDTELWRTHERRRERLVAYARKRLAVQIQRRNGSLEEVRDAGEVLDPRALTIGFARRFATYKRATLLLSNPERFARILQDFKGPVQIIFAGKAHPADQQGKEYIKEIIHFARRHGMRERMVFIEDYDLAVSHYLTGGVDLWLNTPRRPLEASGTSGMKVLPNGGLNCSVLDGWWPEAYTPEVGWSIGAGEKYADNRTQDEIESSALYDLLEKEIIPAFYDRGRDGLPRRWIQMMKASMRTLCHVFNTDRMVQQYTNLFYAPAVSYYHDLIDNQYAGAKEFTAWQNRVRQAWSGVRVDSVEAADTGNLMVGQEIPVKAVLNLGSLTPEDVHVEVYGGRLSSEHEFVQGTVSKMNANGPLDGGRYAYEGLYECEKVGKHGLTVRVMPHHRYCVRPHSLALIKWA